MEEVFVAQETERTQRAAQGVKSGRKKQRLNRSARRRRKAGPKRISQAELRSKLSYRSPIVVFFAGIFLTIAVWMGFRYLWGVEDLRVWILTGVAGFLLSGFGGILSAYYGQPEYRKTLSAYWKQRELGVRWPGRRRRGR